MFGLAMKGIGSDTTRKFLSDTADTVSQIVRWIINLAPFGISNDIAMQMVGVGFIIGVVQDSVETALNSAGDVEFAATAEFCQWRKEGRPLPDFLRKTK